MKVQQSKRKGQYKGDFFFDNHSVNKYIVPSPRVTFTQENEFGRKVVVEGGTSRHNNTSVTMNMETNETSVSKRLIEVES